VLFSNGSTIAQDNANFFWDNTNKRLGIGTNAPNFSLHLYKSSGNVGITLQSSTSYAYVYTDGTNIILGSDAGTTGNKLLINRSAPDNAINVDASGRTSIGYTTNPSTYMLDVNGTGRFSGTAAPIRTESTTNNEMQIVRSTTAYGAGFGFYTGATHNWLLGTAWGETSSNFILYNASTGVKSIKVDYGTSAATFYSSVTATGFFESSDSRLKTLIQDNYQTKGIASITPKLYTKNGKVELGYYAQDFVGILDSAVSKGSDDMLSLSYREVLVAKVYALEQRIKELEGRKFNISTTKLK
jgi:hypothetical protein